MKKCISWLRIIIQNMWIPFPCGGGSSGSTSTSQTQSGTMTQTPEQWVENISKQIGGIGAGDYGNTNVLANQAQANSTGMVNAGNQYTNQGAQIQGQAPGMFGGAYNQAQASSQYNPNTFQQDFLNPYMYDVAAQNANLAQRDFNQQTAPSLMGQMGASGQFNSGRADMGLALAQTQNQQNLNQTNASLMNQGYQQGQQNYLQSMGVGVQGANAMSGAGQGLSGAGQGLANIGQSATNQGLSQLSAPGQQYGQFASATHALPYGSTGTTQSIGYGSQPEQTK